MYKSYQTIFPNLTDVAATLITAKFVWNRFTLIESSKLPVMSRLETFDISYNLLTAVSLQLVLSRSPVIKTLTFTTNPLNVIQTSDLVGSNSLVTLDLAKCELSSIPRFPNMPALQILYLYLNDFTTFISDTFQSVPNLMLLYVRQNYNFALFPDLSYLTNLKVIGAEKTSITEFDIANFRLLHTATLTSTLIRVFPNISHSNLQKLFLDENHLTEVPLGKVSNLAKMMRFYLVNNKLTKFPFEMIDSAPRMILLSLANNQFQTIPDLTWYATPRTNPLEIDFTENPFICDQRLAWLVNFASPNLKILLSEKPCASPPEFINRTWVSITAAELPEYIYGMKSITIF